MKLVWATTADTPAMAAVHATAFPQPWSPEEFADLLEGVGIFGFLAQDEAPLGVILCRIAADEVEVLTLAVDPQARRRGVAKALIAAALGAARQSGAVEAFLEVAMDNDPAASLYAGQGFRREGVRRAYYDRGAEGTMDALVMRLDLRPQDP